MIPKFLFRYFFFYYKEGYIFSLFAFYFLLLTLYPFCFGNPLPSFKGLIWFTTLLSSLLSLEFIFNKDLDDGSVDLIYLTSYSLEFFSLLKFLIHWVLNTTHFLFLLFFYSFDLFFSILLG